MKIECSVEKIRNAVYQTERITGKNLTLPVLNSILLVAAGKTLKLRATNLSLGIEVEIPAKVEKEGIVAVSGSVLNAVFSSITQNDTVHLESKDGNLGVLTKKNKAILKGQPHEDFPTIPRVVGTELQIDSPKLLQGIKSVYWSSSVSDIKPEISSVFVYGDGDNLVFVATDSFRLAEKKIKMRGVGEISGILLPFKNVVEILRVFGEDSGTMEVRFNKNQISFSSDNIYLTSRVIDGVFPDYRQIIPKDSSTEAVVLKQDLLDALKLSNVFSDKFNQINLAIDPKRKVFELSSMNNDVGENKTELSAAIKGEPVELSFNHKYFLDCFQSLVSDSVAIRMSGAGRPLVISPVGDTSFTYLIMPMNR